ncbi:MAG: hypothetical protein AAFY76_08580, partial [Cyanobacteria bacterium J06649_11]
MHTFLGGSFYPQPCRDVALLRLYKSSGLMHYLSCLFNRKLIYKINLQQMKYHHAISSALIGVSIVLVQPQITHALSDIEVGRVAKDITVFIDNQEDPGSGIIIKKSGNTYTVLTASHVIKDKSFKYEIVT